MSKKTLVSLFCIMLAIILMAGCSGNSSATTTAGSTQAAATSAGTTVKPSAANPVKIEFFQQKPEEGPQKGYQEVINRFAKEYNYITIEMNTVPDAAKVLTSRISSNDIPPMFSDYPTQMQFKQKVTNGFVLKLTGQEFLKRANPSALEMAKANDGGDYALPLSNNFMAVFYNTEIFNQYGLSIPKTYNEWLSICETLKGKGVKPLALTCKEPGRVGHLFQGVNIAWNKNGVETIAQACQGKVKIAQDSGFRTVAEKLLKLSSYANDDMFSASDTSIWENFANGKYAMLVCGSYARGTLLIANPKLKMGAFPIPNDTAEATNILTGVDAAISISAKATDAEKNAALKFLEFISRTENAQIFCDQDGAPSCITQTAYKDSGLQPVISMLKTTQVHDWMASTIQANVVTDLYNVVQGFLMDKNIDKFLQDMDKSIATTSAK